MTCKPCRAAARKRGARRAHECQDVFEVNGTSYRCSCSCNRVPVDRIFSRLPRAYQGEGPFPAPGEQCNYFWGSHGCDLAHGDGHSVHRCGHEPTADELQAWEDGELHQMFLGPCSEYDEEEHAIRFVTWGVTEDDREWSNWEPAGSRGWRQ